MADRFGHRDVFGHQERAEKYLRDNGPRNSPSLLDRLWTWLIGQCVHDPAWCIADALEGGGTAADISLIVCRRCGGYKRRWGSIFGTTPIVEEADWHVPYPRWFWRRGRME